MWRIGQPDVDTDERQRGRHQSEHHSNPTEGLNCLGLGRARQPGLEFHIYHAAGGSRIDPALNQRLLDFRHLRPGVEEPFDQ
jgi:hypothetical protein